MAGEVDPKALADAVGDTEAATAALELDKYVRKNSDGTVEVTFEYPFEVIEDVGGGERSRDVESVVLRRPKGKHVRMLSSQDALGNEVETLERIIVDISDLTVRHLADEVDGVDYSRLLAVVTDFFPQPGSK